MTNWATLYRQPTRLPVAVDPVAEQFLCERFACKLTRTGCVNRFTLAQGSTRDGISERAVLYGACRRCPVGQAHARGDPTPENQFPMEATMESIEQTEQPKQYPERQCRRGFHPFTPKTGKERACSDQTCKSRAGNGASNGAASKPNGKHGKRKTRHRQHSPVRIVPQLITGPAKHGAVPEGVRAEGSVEDLLELDASPAELLRLAGFTVTAVKTRNGHFLQVT